MRLIRLRVQIRVRVKSFERIEAAIPGLRWSCGATWYTTITGSPSAIGDSGLYLWYQTDTVRRI